MQVLTVNLRPDQIESINALVGKEGSFPSRSELIRIAVREYLQEQLKAMEEFAQFWKVSK